MDLGGILTQKVMTDKMTLSILSGALTALAVPRYFQDLFITALK